MGPDDLTQERLKEALHYDSSTGIFTWRHRPDLSPQWNGRYADTIAGCNLNGYRVIRLHGRTLYAHRLAWLYMYGKWPDPEIDHINHNRNDNRINNLREVTHKDNNRNHSINKSNKSGVSGLDWDRGAWRARINMSGVPIHLGRFQDKQDAIDALKEARNKYGFHPNHGKERSAA